MTLGIDFRLFQIGHQYRGIGAHLSKLLFEISKMNDQPDIVFYEYPDLESGLPLIESALSDLRSYSIRKTRPSTQGKSFLKRELSSVYERYLVRDAGIIDVSGVDRLLFADYSLGIPAGKKPRSCLIAYDLIPLVLSEHYLPNFFQCYNRTRSIKKAFKAQVEKRLYLNKVRQANKRAHLIIAISEHTNHDIQKYIGIRPEKIKTVLLGADQPTNALKFDAKLKCIDSNGSKTNINLDKTNYVFFMGGSDWRRRITDLVEAFDVTKNYITDMKLVLAGYDFSSSDKILDSETKLSIESSAHKKDILFAGFINEEQRNSLYKCSVAFIFPSVYEGFGLPLIEAMQLQCPVITYKNSSLGEIGGDAAIYAKNSEDIAKQIMKLSNKTFRSKIIRKGLIQVKKFSWNKTASQTLKYIYHQN